MTLREKLTRLLHPYKLKHVARAAGLNHQSVAFIVSGKHTNPKLATVKAIARTLGVDPFWLLDDTKGFPPVRVGPPGLDDYKPASLDMSEVAA